VIKKVNHLTALIKIQNIMHCKTFCGFIGKTIHNVFILNEQRETLYRSTFNSFQDTLTY